MLVQRMDITAENAELGEMPERKAEAIRTPRFFDLGVKLAYDFKLYKTVDLQLNGGVQNIFESFRRTLTEELTGIPVIFTVLLCREVFLPE